MTHKILSIVYPYFFSIARVMPCPQHADVHYASLSSALQATPSAFSDPYEPHETYNTTLTAPVRPLCGVLGKKH